MVVTHISILWKIHNTCNSFHDKKASEKQWAKPRLTACKEKNLFSAFAIKESNIESSLTAFAVILRLCNLFYLPEAFEKRQHIYYIYRIGDRDLDLLFLKTSKLRFWKEQKMNIPRYVDDNFVFIDNIGKLFRSFNKPSSF